MPIYEYLCLDCDKRFEVFLRYQDFGEQTIICPDCKGDRVKRMINRVRISSTTQTRFEDFTDPAMMDRLEEDPRAIGRMMREMGKEAGEELGPEFDDVVDRLESGQSPQEIENDLPDFNGSDGSSGGSNEDI